MDALNIKKGGSRFYRVIASVILVAFFTTTILPPGYAQTIGLTLPLPGSMVGPSAEFVPVLLKGMTLHPENPLQFEFIIDSGHEKLAQEELKKESERLVKYFLASMTVPQNDLWVNLSPYEKDRIIPDELGKTELGRDLLAQDYILKQLTATLMYPEEDLGKKFWNRMRALAKKEYGVDEIPTDVFNKVWILPEKATVYEYENTVYIVESKLKVMLDSDYEAMRRARLPGAPLDGSPGASIPTETRKMTESVIREIILPEIEKEVNSGKNFAPLRQIYHSLILAKWYKQTVKNSLMSQVYIDKNKTAGIEISDTQMKERIYDQYMQAYKKGVFNYIKEDYDALSQTVIPKQYFSGGFQDSAMLVGQTRNAALVARARTDQEYLTRVNFEPQTDAAMLTTVAEARKLYDNRFYDREVTRQAARIIIAKGDASDIDRLLKMLTFSDGDLDQPLEQKLVELGATQEQIVDAYLFRLDWQNHSYFRNRNNLTIKRLVELDDPRAIPNLIWLINTSSHEEALAALKELGVTYEQFLDGLVHRISVFIHDSHDGALRYLASMKGKPAQALRQLLQKLEESIPEGKHYSVRQKVAEHIKEAWALYKQGFDFEIRYIPEKDPVFIATVRQTGTLMKHGVEFSLSTGEKYSHPDTIWFEDVSLSGKSETIPAWLWKKIHFGFSPGDLVSGERDTTEILKGKPLKVNPPSMHGKVFDREAITDAAMLSIQEARKILKNPDNYNNEIRLAAEQTISKQGITTEIDELIDIYIARISDRNDANRTKALENLEKLDGEKIQEFKNVLAKLKKLMPKSKHYNVDVKVAENLQEVWALYKEGFDFEIKYIREVDSDNVEILRGQRFEEHDAIYGVDDSKPRNPALQKYIETIFQKLGNDIILSIGRGQNYHFAPEEEEFESGSGLIFTLKNNKPRLDYILKTGGSQKAAEEDRRPNSEKKVALPHQAQPQSGRCPLCGIPDDNILKKIRFHGAEYALIVNPNPWAHEHFMLVTKEKVAQSVFKREIWAGLALTRELGEEYEGLFNAVEAAASVYHFHIQFHRGPAVIWKNLDEGRIKEKKERIYDDGVARVVEIEGWPAKVILFRSSDGDRISTLMDHMIGVLEQEVHPYNIMFRYKNGSYEMVVYPRTLNRERPTNLNTDKVSWSRFGGMEMSGILLLLSDTGYKEMKRNHSKAGQNYADALKEMSATNEELENIKRRFQESLSWAYFKTAEQDVHFSNLNTVTSPDSLKQWVRQAGVKILLTERALDDVDRETALAMIGNDVLLYTENAKKKYRYDAQKDAWVSNPYFELRQANNLESDAQQRITKDLSALIYGFTGINMQSTEVTEVTNDKEIKSKSEDNAMLSQSPQKPPLTEGLPYLTEELHRFFRFINDPQSDSDYLSGHSPEEIRALLSDDVIASAEEFKKSPDSFTRDQLVSNGTALIPTHFARIEIDRVQDGSVRQIFLRGIPLKFIEIAKKHLREKLKGTGIFVNNSGKYTIDLRYHQVNKDKVIDFVQANFNTLLDQMGYTPGDAIDARRSRTVIAMDADGTLWGLVNVQNAPSLTESEDFDALLDYLEAGGVVLITTGNLYERTLQRLEDNGGIPLHLRNRIIISTSGATTLYVYDNQGRLKEINDYLSYLDSDQQPSQNDSQALDIIYIGDSHQRTGNDYPAFRRVGFNRSCLVTEDPITDVPEELKSSYFGNNVSGTKKVMEAAVRLARRQGRNIDSPVFKDDALETIKREMLRHAITKIDAGSDLKELKSPQSVTRATEVLSIHTNTILIEGREGKGRGQSEEIARRFLQNSMAVAGYRLDLGDIQLTDPVTQKLLPRLIEQLVPDKGRIVLVLQGLTEKTYQSALLRELMANPAITLVGVTDFNGYRELEKDRFLAKDLNFIITEPEHTGTEKEKRVLVIGASGFLGEKVFRMYQERAQDKSTVLGTAFSKRGEFDQLDVRDPVAIEQYLKDHEVDVVIYAAGEADADKTKNDLTRARALNADVVRLIKRNFNGKFVYISTEYIFDGKHETAPYISTSPRNPVNEYGQTKLLGEDLTLEEFNDPIILRIGVLYGYNHPNDKAHYAKVVLEKLRAGQDFEADDKQLKRPVMTDDVAATIIKLVDHNASGIFQINGSEPMTKYQEALAIADVYYETFPDAREVTITPTYAEYSAPRPLNTFMVNTDTPRPFRQGVRDMLDQAMLSEKIQPGLTDHPVPAKKPLILDPGEAALLKKIQDDIRSGRLTPDNVDDYNRITGTITPYTNIVILPDNGSQRYAELVRTGRAQRDAVGFSMGGLSTRSGGRMRPGFRFFLNSVDSDAHSMLEWKLGNIRYFNKTNQETKKPVLIMTSFATQESYDKISKKMEGFGLQETGLYNYDNGVQYRLEWDPRNPDSLGSIAIQQDGTPVMNPSGHYSFIRQLVVTGLLAQLKRNGIDFIYHSNLSNFGALIDEEYDALRGLFHEKIDEARRTGQELPMTLIEVVKNPQTQIGSYPVLVDGKFVLLRWSMFPKNFSTQEVEFFNTGNYHFYVDAILQRLGFDENYDSSYTTEDIIQRFDAAFPVRPEISAKAYINQSSSASGQIINTLQVERNIDDLVSTAPVIVAAVSDDRFIAAKTEDALKSQRKRLDRVLQGKVDVRFGPYRLEDISDDDKKHATTSFMTFRPFIRDQIWGGFWLNYLKNHKAFDESVTSETVEISSHPYFPSIMVLKSGISMDVTDVAHFGFADDFFGKRVVKEFGPRFPFIAKFLDAQKALSIQVHPSHEQARDLEKYEDALGKEEVFFIIGAEEDNEMVFGLDEDMSIDRFLEAVRNQDPAIEGMLHRITVQPGEIYRVPYGAVHAFQRGIQAIELGHMSDLTYRIYDYNRKERLPALASDRTVHIPESLGSINFNLPRGKELVDLFKKSWTTTQTLNNGAGKIQTADISPEFHADRFVFMGLGENKGQIIESTTVKTSTDGRFHFLMAAKGSVELRRVLDGQTAILRMGESIFIPAGLGDYEIITNNSLQSIIYRFYPQFPEEYTKYNIAISLGGSKFMFGLVDKNGSILHDREFNWKEKLRGEDITADRIEELMMDELAQLLDRFAIRPDQIEEIGIAWPGPIDYQTRRVTATYLPFDKHPLAETISRRYMDRYQHKVDVKPILDVLADILGEKKHTKGALQGKSDGMVLNLATGIAMGILKDDEILDSASYDAPDQNSPMIIETGLPQIGRHLIRRKSDPKSWEYRPTPDGSVPNFDNNQYERFSQALGGPFIARRYIETLIGEYGADHTGYFEKAPEMPLKDIAEKLAQRNNSDEAVTVEKMVLTELTTKAYDGDETAADLVKKIGYEFGSALATFVRSFPKIFNIADHEWDLVLVGSVGEKLGNPKRLEGIYQYYDDIFLPAFQQGLDDNGAKGVKVSRSEMEQDGKRIREIVAFQSDSTDKRIFAKLYAEEDQDNAMLGSQNPLLKEINTILKHVTRHGTISQQQIDELSGLIERVRQESPDNDFQIVAEMIKRAQKDSLADYHKADEYGEAALVRENNGAYFSVWFTLRELLHSDSQKIQKLMDEKNLPELHKLVSAKKAKAYTAAVAPLALSYDDRIIITIDSARKIIEFLSINGDRISLETLEELRSDLAETLYFLTHSPHYDNLSAAEYQFYEKHRFMLYDDSADKNDLETLIKITEDAITALQSIDSAMLGDQNQAQDVQNGGIDMNEIAVDRANEDAAGTIQFEMQGMEPLLNMDIQGFSPIIIDMVPINSVLPLLGLAPTEKGIKFGKEEAQEGLQLSKIES